MTADTYSCDAYDACASCDADLVAAERAEGRNPHIPLSLRPLKPLVKATGPCQLDHEHDYMCPGVCTGCEVMGCQGECMDFEARFGAAERNAR